MTLFNTMVCSFFNQENTNPEFTGAGCGNATTSPDVYASGIAAILINPISTNPACHREGMIFMTDRYCRIAPNARNDGIFDWLLISSLSSYIHLRPSNLSG
jgi:hypothetical protein